MPTVCLILSLAAGLDEVSISISISRRMTVKVQEYFLTKPFAVGGAGTSLVLYKYGFLTTVVSNLTCTAVLQSNQHIYGHYIKLVTQ